MTMRRQSRRRLLPVAAVIAAASVAAATPAFAADPPSPDVAAAVRHATTHTPFLDSLAPLFRGQTTTGPPSFFGRMFPDLPALTGQTPQQIADLAGTMLDPNVTDPAAGQQGQPLPAQRGHLLRAVHRPRPDPRPDRLAHRPRRPRPHPRRGIVQAGPVRRVLRRPHRVPLHLRRRPPAPPRPGKQRQRRPRPAPQPGRLRDPLRTAQRRERDHLPDPHRVHRVLQPHRRPVPPALRARVAADDLELPVGSAP